MPPTAKDPAKTDPPRKRVGSRHDKTGCLTCRCRRKKCLENTFPTCGACKRLNLKCIRAPARNVVSSSTSLESSQTSSHSRISNQTELESATSPNQRLAVPSWTPPYSSGPGVRVESPHQRHAFRYYVTVLAYHLTVSERFNSFLSALLPMAMESVPLRDCLVAFAAGHLSLTDQSYKLPALEARCKALSSLSRSVNTLSNEIGHHEANAAACLTFVICDVGVDAGEAWINHLSAAQHIITTAKAVSSTGKVLEGPDAFKTSSEGEWILRNFAYHDIIGCMTTRKRPLLGAAYLNDIADVVDSYVGVATDLLILAAEIGRIEDETQTEHDATPQVVQKNIALFHKRCADLQHQLQAWKCQEGTATELAAVAYAYRSAILIVLYRLVRSRLRSGYFSSVSDARSDSRAARSIQDKIDTHVEEVLNHVAKVPLGATPESPLLFPIFIAGGETLQPVHMEAVRNRLKHTFEQRRFLNIATALEMLEELWRRRGREEPGLDWSDILAGSGKQLLLT